MSMDFYYGSGSPYGWRVWLALEYKQAPYSLKTLSFSAGDSKKPEFLAINPRGRIPAIMDGGYALYESAAILEYLEERFPEGPHLFPTVLHERATARRVIREADEYLAHAMEAMVDQILFTTPDEWDADAIGSAAASFRTELTRFENYAPDGGFFMGAAGAVDFSLYPLIALALRMEKRKPDLNIRVAIGTRLTAWMQRVEALPFFAATIPPHWQAS